MTILPDTNAVTGLQLGNPAVVSFFETADLVYLSPVVLGELRYGYQNGNREKENVQFLQKLANKPNVHIFKIGEETAEIYADLRTKLKRIGKPIPSNDLWIAAQAIEKGTILLTNDEHFEPILALRCRGF